MTSEAKKGLLLGLIFIFITAFLINGLPKLSPGKNTSELTKNMTKPVTDTHALAVRERKAISQTKIIEEKTLPKSIARPNKNPKVRFRMDLPQTASNKNPADTQKTQAKARVLLTSQTNQKIKKVQTKPALPKYYLVAKGDSLASIAKKIYGPDKGNKLVNIEKLFKANADNITSPDEIYVGQKLLIPAPERTGQAKNPAQNNKTKNSIYTVQQGDSLWRIAKKCLGNPSRYIEIANLNANILTDKDSLTVGMRLKLPAR